MRSYQLILAPLIGLCILRAQTVTAQDTKPQEPAQSSIKRNPFEPVPEPPQVPPSKVSGPIIEAIEFQGARRVPQTSLRAVIASRVGSVYDIETLRRDAQTLYNTSR